MQHLKTHLFTNWSNIEYIPTYINVMITFIYIKYFNNITSRYNKYLRMTLCKKCPCKIYKLDGRKLNR